MIAERTAACWASLKSRGRAFSTRLRTASRCSPGVKAVEIFSLPTGFKRPVLPVPERARKSNSDSKDSCVFSAPVESSGLMVSPLHESTAVENSVEFSLSGLMVSPLHESTAVENSVEFSLSGLMVSPLARVTVRRKLHWKGVPSSLVVAPGRVVTSFFRSSPATARFTDSRAQPVEIESTLWLTLPMNSGGVARCASSTSTRNSASVSPGRIAANCPTARLATSDNRYLVSEGTWPESDTGTSARGGSRIAIASNPFRAGQSRDPSPVAEANEKSVLGSPCGDGFDNILL